jgi:integrase
MAKVKAPRVPITDVTMIEEDDVNRMLRACSPWSTFERARDAAIISMLWATGVRRGELAALRLDDIDIDSMTLVVRESKSGKSRRVPFDSRATGHLLRYLSKRERYAALPKAPEALWLGKAGRFGSDGICQMIQRRRDAVGVKASAHSFRRSLAARALSKGVSGASTSVLLGWAPGSIMLSRYTRMVAEETAAAEYRRALG